MTILEEYTNNIKNSGWQLKDFENELTSLIKKYNELRNTNLVVYVSSFANEFPTSLNRDDFYNFKDLLDGIEENQNLDIYIETPGGSATCVEEIVRYIRERYNKVSFVVCGHAKSAGTIMVMGADEILMTKTASLGPIDAQIVSSRGIVSAFDYVEWINDKKKESKETGMLNPVDKEIISQITPGEINGVEHALEYAKDLVKEWIFKYSFNNLNISDKEKEIKAKEIADTLSNHSLWKTHDKNLKIEDLENIGLNITHIDDNDELKDIVYRINLICRLIFNMSNNYKMIYTSFGSLVFSFNRNQEKKPIIENVPSVLDVNLKCDLCGREYAFYAKLINDHNIDKDMKKKGKLPLPKNNLFKCKCGSIMNLSNVRKDIENNFGKKVL